VFDREVKKLVELGLVAMKEGKVYKQNAIYHFLTHDGELAFAFKFGRQPDVKVVEIDKDKVVQVMTLKGWEPKEKSKDGIVFEHNGSKIVKLVALPDAERISKDIEESAVVGEIYIVCGSDAVKNAVMQQAAKFNYNHRGMNMVIFAATLDELKEEGFKKVEFSAEE
jgi:hypothetical protein